MSFDIWPAYNGEVNSSFVYIPFIPFAKISDLITLNIRIIWYQVLPVGTVFSACVLNKRSINNTVFNAIKLLWNEYETFR
jgi:hypothetical protein